ncbi:MAG: metal ABC transporter permease [candidate division Zixibacteria bacterium]|nr:metal ABC transporter permease [candidate division Zixibacteria bacterium]
MIEALQFEFFRNAVIAGVLTGIACGIIGALVVVNRIVFIGGGIAHAAYGGIGLAIFLGISPLLGAMGFTVAVTLVLALLTVKNKERVDTAIGLIWATGMAFGVILIDLTPGYNVDLMSYLFGSILAIPSSNIWLLLMVNVVIFGFLWYFYRDILAMSYDEEFGITINVPVKGLYFLMLLLTAVTIVLVIRLVGLILVIALLTIPPFIAERSTSSLSRMIMLSSALSVIFILAGLALSYSFNLTSGATIILVASFAFAVHYVLRAVRKG